MSSKQTREQLEGLRRADLQKIGKTLGFKANLKSDALIDLILASNVPHNAVAGPSRASVPPSRPTSRATSRPPSVRKASGSVPPTLDTFNFTVPGHERINSSELKRSTRDALQGSTSTKPASTVSVKPSSTISRTSSLFSSRAPSLRRASSVPAKSRDISRSSVIVHDEDEEESPNAAAASIEPKPMNASEVLPPRRKAKDTQFRLGVGRPMVAGGSGARTVTNASKGKGLLARNVTQSQPTIIEEDGEEPEHVPAPAPLPEAPTPTVLPAATPLPIMPTNPTPGRTAMPMLDVFAFKSDIDRQVSMMWDQIQGLQSTLTTTLHALSEKVATINVLEAEVKRLSTQVRLITNAPNNNSNVGTSGSSSSNINTPASYGTPSALPPITNSKKAYPSTLGRASVAPTLPASSLLGKHSREASTDVESGPSDLAMPSNKRKKLGDKTALFRSDIESMEGRISQAATPDTIVSHSTPAFTVFEGPEEEPVHAHTSGTPNAQSNQAPITSPSRTQPENQLPTNHLDPFAPGFELDVSLSMVPSTMGVPALPRPSTGYPFFEERSGFEGETPLGVMSPSHPRDNHGLSISPFRRGPSAAHINMFLGMPPNPDPDLPSEEGVKHIKLYTEDDLRFGDFGIEGMANWASGSMPTPRF